MTTTRPRRPKLGKSLAEARPEIAATWHPDLNGDITPRDVGPTINFPAWWLCPECGEPWQTNVGNRKHAPVCPSCLKAARPEPGASFADLHPDAAAEWHPTLNRGAVPQEAKPRSRKLRWWQCARDGFVWQTRITDRAAGSGCPRCAEKGKSERATTPPPGESFADLYPDLAAQWHPNFNGATGPRDVFPKSAFRAWWLCPACRAAWDTRVFLRAGGSGCPRCAAKLREGPMRPKAGKSLAELRPLLAAEWHPNRNKDTTPRMVRPGSQHPAWWLCPTCGGVWQARVDARARTNGTGCPKCARKRGGGQREPLDAR